MGKKLQLNERDGFVASSTDTIDQERAKTEGGQLRAAFMKSMAQDYGCVGQANLGTEHDDPRIPKCEFDANALYYTAKEGAEKPRTFIDAENMIKRKLTELGYDPSVYTSIKVMTKPSTKNRGPLVKVTIPDSLKRRNKKEEVEMKNEFQLLDELDEEILHDEDTTPAELLIDDLAAEEASIPAPFDKYYELDQETADQLDYIFGVDGSINGYSEKAVAFLVAKDEYFDTLADDNLEHVILTDSKQYPVCVFIGQRLYPVELNDIEAALVRPYRPFGHDSYDSGYIDDEGPAFDESLNEANAEYVMKDDPLISECKKLYSELADEITEGANADVPNNIKKAFAKVGGTVRLSTNSDFISYNGKVDWYTIAGTISLSSLVADAHRLAEDLTMAYYRTHGGTGINNTPTLMRVLKESDVQILPNHKDSLDMLNHDFTLNEAVTEYVYSVGIDPSDRDLLNQDIEALEDFGLKLIGVTQEENDLSTGSMFFQGKLKNIENYLDQYVGGIQIVPAYLVPAKEFDSTISSQYLDDHAMDLHEDTEDDAKMFNIGSNKDVPVGSLPYRRIEAVCKALNDLKPISKYTGKPLYFTVEPTWEDYGAGMRWKTIISHETSEDNLIGDGTVQILSPMQWMKIANGEWSVEEAVQDELNDKWCGFRVPQKPVAESKKLREKLVEPDEEDLKKFKDKFAELGLEIEAEGKTWTGRKHYQLRKELDHNVTDEDLEPIFDALCDLDEEPIRSTCSVGVHRDGDNIISAAVDVDKKYVPDNSNESLTEAGALKEGLSVWYYFDDQEYPYEIDSEEAVEYIKDAYTVDELKELLNEPNEEYLDDAIWDSLDEFKEILKDGFESQAREAWKDDKAYKTEFDPYRWYESLGYEKAVDEALDFEANYDDCWVEFMDGKPWMAYQSYRDAQNGMFWDEMAEAQGYSDAHHEYELKYLKNGKYYASEEEAEGNSIDEAFVWGEDLKSTIPAPYDKYYQIMDSSEAEEWGFEEEVIGSEILPGYSEKAVAILRAKPEYEDVLADHNWDVVFLTDSSDYPLAYSIGDRLYSVDASSLEELFENGLDEANYKASSAKNKAVWKVEAYEIIPSEDDDPDKDEYRPLGLSTNITYEEIDKARNGLFSRWIKTKRNAGGEPGTPVRENGEFRMVIESEADKKFAAEHPEINLHNIPHFFKVTVVENNLPSDVEELGKFLGKKLLPPAGYSRSSHPLRRNESLKEARLRGEAGLLDKVDKWCENHGFEKVSDIEYRLEKDDGTYMTVTVKRPAWTGSVITPVSRGAIEVESYDGPTGEVRIRKTSYELNDDHYRSKPIMDMLNNSYHWDILGESLADGLLHEETLSLSDDQILKKMKEFMAEEGGYNDYSGYINDLMEKFGLSKYEAECWFDLYATTPDWDDYEDDDYDVEESLNEAKKVGLVSAAKWALRKANKQLKDASPEEVYNRALKIAGRSEYPFVKNNLEAKKDAAIEFIKVIREAEWNPELDESLNLGGSEINLPGYGVQYVSGYGGWGVNHTETEYFRTEEEQKKFAKELEDRHAVGVETFTVPNFYHTYPADESLEEAFGSFTVVLNSADPDYDKAVDYIKRHCDKKAYEVKNTRGLKKGEKLWNININSYGKGAVEADRENYIFGLKRSYPTAFVKANGFGILRESYYGHPEIEYASGMLEYKGCKFDEQKLEKALRDGHIRVGDYLFTDKSGDRDVFTKWMDKNIIGVLDTLVANKKDPLAAELGRLDGKALSEGISADDFDTVGKLIQYIHDADDYLWNCHDTDYRWLYRILQRYGFEPDTPTIEAEVSMADAIDKMPEKMQLRVLDHFFEPVKDESRYASLYELGKQLISGSED